MKPMILITNDDGILSPGLVAAVEAVADLADVISAPHIQQTGMGRAFPRTEDTGIIEEVEMSVRGRSVRGYSVHGSPAFAVAHGILELSERKPDLCISGINYGENLGTVLTCSGTFGAALEAVSHRVPAIAVSLEADFQIQRSNEFQDTDWGASIEVLRIWTSRVLQPFLLKSHLAVDEDTLEKDSDIYAVYVDKVASVTPVNIVMSVGM